MTLVGAPEVPVLLEAELRPNEALAEESPVGDRGVVATGSTVLAPQRRRLAAVWVGVWILALVGAMGMVIYGLGPLFQARDQRKLAARYRLAVERAANESTGLGGVSTPTTSPDLGTPVAILEIGSIHVQQVVVEGAFASQTRAGPGHVTGTAGLGQLGNSVVVGRAHAFGGTFADLGRLRKGNTILVTTTQGQSVYRVTTVAHKDLGNVGETYGATPDSRLTLVTSASGLPWNDSEGIVVVASIQGLPFPATPQNGRVSTGLGTGGDDGADAAVVLALFAFAATISASIALYRRVRPATAYLLSIGPLIATAIMAGETLSRLLPAWT